MVDRAVRLAAWVAAAVATAMPPQAHPAEVCSAWSEPGRIAAQIELRQRHRLRSDQPWVLEVARSSQASFGYGGILMAPEEQQEFRARFTKLGEQESERRPFIQQAMAYAEAQPSFAGSYVRRVSEDLFDPPVALVLMFTGDPAVHEKALVDLPAAQIKLEIRPARFTLQQLKARMQAMNLDARSLEAEGIDLMGYGPKVEENIIRLEARSNRPDAVARLEAGHEGMVKAVIYPLPDDSKRVAVTEGRGWRLLGRAKRSGSTPPAPEVATSQVEWDRLRNANSIAEPRRSVDFSKEIVVMFLDAISCGTKQLDDVLIDRRLQSIDARFSSTGVRGGGCGAAYVGYEVFAVAVERAALPPNPIGVPEYPWSKQWGEPPYERCPRSLVIPEP